MIQMKLGFSFLIFNESIGIDNNNSKVIFSNIFFSIKKILRRILVRKTDKCGVVQVIVGIEGI